MLAAVALSGSLVAVAGLSLSSAPSYATTCPASNSGATTNQTAGPVYTSGGAPGSSTSGYVGASNNSGPATGYVEANGSATGPSGYVVANGSGGGQTGGVTAGTPPNSTGQCT